MNANGEDTEFDSEFGFMVVNSHGESSENIQLINRPQLSISERSFVLEKMLMMEPIVSIIKNFNIKFGRTIHRNTIRKILIKWKKFHTEDNRNKGNSGRKFTVMTNANLELYRNKLAAESSLGLQPSERYFYL